MDGNLKIILMILLMILIISGNCQGNGTNVARFRFISVDLYGGKHHTSKPQLSVFPKSKVFTSILN